MICGEPIVDPFTMGGFLTFLFFMCPEICHVVVLGVDLAGLIQCRVYNISLIINSAI